MKIYCEFTVYDLREKLWGGASDTIKDLRDNEIEQILCILEDCYPDGISLTSLNDVFWFERCTLAEWLGVSCYEELMNRDE